MSILGVSSLGKFIMIFASMIIIFVLYLFLLSIRRRRRSIGYMLGKKEKIKGDKESEFL